MIRVADPVTTGVSNRLETTDHNPYNDVTDAHWAFYQIMEASVAHDHDYDEDGMEFWDGLK